MARKSAAVPAKEQLESAAVFTKEQLEASEEFRNQRDLVKAILKDGVPYTKEEATCLLNEFMERTVN